jgi:hypothetical protein
MGPLHAAAIELIPQAPPSTVRVILRLLLDADEAATTAPATTAASPSAKPPTRRTAGGKSKFTKKTATPAQAAPANEWESLRQSVLTAMRDRCVDFQKLGKTLNCAPESVRTCGYRRQLPARPRLVAALRSWLASASNTAVPEATATFPFRGAGTGNGAHPRTHAA